MIFQLIIVTLHSNFKAKNYDEENIDGTSLYSLAIQ